MISTMCIAVILITANLVHLSTASICMHTLNAALSPKTISSPNFPEHYENEANCTWLITADQGRQIELKFFIVDIEPEYDTLTIFDGNNDNSSVLSTLHGNIHVSSSILSSTGQLFLRFKSDGSVTERGFRVQYRIALETKINISSVIQACLADTTIRSEVMNFDRVPREVEFKVVFPQQAYITKFFMVIDGVRYVGVVEKKENVIQRYEEIQIQGITMGYVSSTKELAKTFFTGIMLQPGKTVIFEIVYQQLLQRRIGRYTNTIILTREFFIHQLSVDIYICARSNLTFLQVPTIEEAGRLSYIGQVRFLGRKDYFQPGVTVKRNANVAHISYRSFSEGRTEPVSPKRSVLVTHYDVYRGDSGTLSVIGEEYFATFFSPVKPNLIRRIVFVLDVSGSMAGNKIEQVKIAMKDILNRLTGRDSFNIVQFESVVRTWKPSGLVAASKTAKASARKYIDSFDPEGKTNIHGALIKGISLLTQGTRITPWNRNGNVNAYRDYVFFLGDGKPTVGLRNKNDILKAVKNANKRGYGINAIGFGKNVDVDFLQRLTRDNHGKWRIIYEAEDSHMQIQNFIAELGVAIMTDISFTYSPSQVNFTTNRKGLVLVNGGEVGVFGRLLPNVTDEFIDVTITGKTFKFVTSVFRLPMLKNVSKCALNGLQIDGFAARGYGIAKLQETLLTLRQNTDKEQKDQLTAEATRISLEFDLVTPLTFLVVKKQNTTKDNTKGTTTEQPDKDGIKGLKIPEVGELKNPEKPPVEKGPGNIVGPLPGDTKPWVFEGDPHFIVALGNNITVCFTWNGTDGEIYNLLDDPVTGITLNGLIKYGPRASHSNEKSECNITDDGLDITNDAKEDVNDVCNRNIESFFVKLGFVFKKEKLKIEITPNLVKIIDEKNPKRRMIDVIPASDEAVNEVRGVIGITVYNVTKVHSFVNITVNGTVSFVINLKRGRNLPPEKKRPSLIDHMDMDISGHENFSPFTGGLFGMFPKDADKDVTGVKKSHYAVARLRRPGVLNLLKYRKHSISVAKISIPDPYTKIPRQCWFTYEENAVTGRADDAFRVRTLFQVHDRKPPNQNIRI